jgi:hypothetical protein
VGSRELLDRLERERSQLDPLDAGVPGQSADDDAQRMIRLQLVVAVCDENEASRACQPAAQEAKKVQARLVGPVVVLEHEHRPRSPELVEQRGRDLVRARVSLDQLRERAAGLRGDVRNRRERPGREQGVAGPDQDAGARLALGCECPDEGGLSATGFGADQDEPAAAFLRLPARLAQRREGRLALQENGCGCDGHDSMVIPRGVGFKERGRHSAADPGTQQCTRGFQGCRSPLELGSQTHAWRE